MRRHREADVAMDPIGARAGRALRGRELRVTGTGQLVLNQNGSDAHRSACGLRIGIPARRPGRSERVDRVAQARARRLVSAVFGLPRTAGIAKRWLAFRRVAGDAQQQGAALDLEWADSRKIGTEAVEVGKVRGQNSIAPLSRRCHHDGIHHTPFTAAIASPAMRAKSGKRGSMTQASRSAATRAERLPPRDASTMTGVGTVSSYPNCSASFSWAIVRRAARSNPINAPVSRVMPAILPE